MISLEKAKALKEAGLLWEPQRGDLYYYPNGEFSGTLIVMGSPPEWTIKLESVFEQTWLPSLSQLLAEIERREWNWLLENNGEIEIWDDNPNILRKYFDFTADTPADAAADALLWVLGQEKEETSCK